MICINCSKEYSEKKYGKYCSSKCKKEYLKNNNATLKRNCIYCGKIFTSNNKHKKFCCNKCKYTYFNKLNSNKTIKNKSDRHRIIVYNVCFICGKRIPNRYTIHEKCLDNTRLKIDERFIYKEE